jgi:beta-1,4-mannosyl-glycoprotein beta-1,4-N-acetylglucosaminyltransferase
MRVFDCFPLFNEIDLLELRLNELWDVVDIFVIAEAKTTFTGNSKPMCLPDNAERLAKYMHKIRYVVVEDFPEGISNWGREEYQRNEMKKELSDVLPDDILVFSDVDEIPRAKVIQSIAERGIQPKEVYCLSLDWYSFYLNIKISEKWERIGPRIIRAGDLSEFQSLRRVMGPTRGWARDMMRQIKSSWRMGHWVKRIRVPDAGWHFTWMVVHYPFIPICRKVKKALHGQMRGSRLCSRMGLATPLSRSMIVFRLLCAIIWIFSKNTSCERPRDRATAPPLTMLTCRSRQIWWMMSRPRSRTLPDSTLSPHLVDQTM